MTTYALTDVDTGKLVALVDTSIALIVGDHIQAPGSNDARGGWVVLARTVIVGKVQECDGIPLYTVPGRVELRVTREEKAVANLMRAFDEADDICAEEAVEILAKQAAKRGQSSPEEN